jgi:hypothetical protein
MFETNAAEAARPLPVPRAPTSTGINARDAPTGFGAPPRPTYNHHGTQQCRRFPE